MIRQLTKYMLFLQFAAACLMAGAAPLQYCLHEDGSGHPVESDSRLECCHENVSGNSAPPCRNCVDLSIELDTALDRYFKSAGQSLDIPLPNSTASASAVPTLPANRSWGFLSDSNDRFPVWENLTVFRSVVFLL